MVEKYGLPKSEAPHYCLVQSNLSMPEDGAPGVVVGGGTTREYILDDDDCPLNILMNHQVGHISHRILREPLRKKIPDYLGVFPKCPLGKNSQIIPYLFMRGSLIEHY